MVPAQIISLVSDGMLNGFKKIFHFDSDNESLKINTNKPIRTITTAVPFPFLITVENINDKHPINNTGYIT